MNFKRIEMVGFKSFADPIKLTFEEGITAIVGPNGCGKSNVADAIRWVLGEQSSKTLRASNMQDVIFKGTEKRRSMSFCEVSLCFDNTNHIFKTDMAEIVITRKLYRSGDSEYLMNGTTCRLRDIHELMRDSGLGKSGYSIIGQGKVEEIINSKPEDRRSIFEEAAGIANFKVKKDDAEKRLERTSDNLQKINILVSEIDRQLGPLRKQSETAKKYLELKEQLKLLEVNAYIYQYDSAASNKEEILNRINALMEELELKSAALDDATNRYNESFEKMNHIDQDIAKLRDLILEYTVELEKQTGESNLMQEKLRQCKLEDQRLQEEYKKVQETIVSYQRELTNRIDQQHQEEKELSQTKTSLGQLEQKYETIITELSHGEMEAENSRQQLFDALSKLGDVKAKISALQTEKSNYQSRIADSHQQLNDLEAKLQQNIQAKNEIVETTNQVSNQKDKIAHLVTNGKQQLESLASKIKLTEGDLGNDKASLLSLQQRKKLLEDMQKEYEGFVGSVRKLLTDSEKNSALKEKIVGVLANLIEVPTKYQTAIEMALGNAVQNIVTYDDNGAKNLVQYLKQKEYGRVTFLPINTIRGRKLDASYTKHLSTAGCFGVASTLIGYPNNIENIVTSFLGTTVIVDNINTAVALAKQSNYGFKIVTLDGDIINPLGSITGGSKKAQIANLLSREADIKLAEETIAKLQTTITTKQKQLDSIQAEYTTTQNTYNSNFDLLKELEISLATKSEQLDKYSMMIHDFEEEKTRLTSIIAQSNQMLDTIAEQLSKMDDSGVESSDINLSNNQFDHLKQQRDNLNDQIMTTKVKIASLTSSIQNLSNEIERLEFMLATNETNKISLEDQILNNNEIMVSYKDLSQKQVSVTESGDLLSKLNNVKTEVATLEEEKINNQNNLRQLEQSRMNLSAEVSRIQDKKYQQEMNLTKIDTDIETLQERVWTEYELTYSTALDYKQEYFDLKSGMQNISKLKKEIAALGYINVNAIEDCKLLEARHGDLYNQAQDLLKAEEDLKKIIKELSAEMVVRFKEEFDKINANFGVTFKELFGGGSAKLQLTDKDDILSSGVDIIAEPPGKKLSNITLLSGGEKSLTAIAILLAILHMKPMPFCLLDEIEAALDEANVDRFARYIKRYSNETQFIVITHKKPTMEHADTLYGVTMEEKGVSKIVSVKLSEAIQNVEEN